MSSALSRPVLALCACFAAILGLSTTAAAGVAIGYKHARDSDLGDEGYIIRYNSSATGYEAEKAVSAAFQEEYNQPYPDARHSSRGEVHVYFVVISCTRTIYNGKQKTKTALGWSTRSADGALQEAFAEMSRRDWGWSKEKHGYSVEQTGDTF